MSKKKIMPEIGKEVELQIPSIIGAKGTIEYSIEFNGTQVKVIHTPGEESLMVQLFGALKYIEHLEIISRSNDIDREGKIGFYKDKDGRDMKLVTKAIRKKDRFTPADRHEITMTRKVLVKVFGEFAGKLYQKASKDAIQVESSQTE